MKVNESSVAVVSVDASTVAYAATIHIVTLSEEKKFVSLICSSSKLAQKNMSIPRLELFAALLGARLKVNVDTALQRSLPCVAVTDSSTVLSWIKSANPPSKFEESRIIEIQSKIPESSWFWISTKANISDLLTRGLAKVEDIVAGSDYQSGPSWMYLDQRDWPIKTLQMKFAAPAIKLSQDIADEIEEELEVTAATADTREVEVNNPQDAISSLAADKQYSGEFKVYSTFSKTVRVYSIVVKFVKTLQRKASRGPPRMVDLLSARKFLFSRAQAGSLGNIREYKQQNAVIEDGLVVARFRGHQSTALISARLSSFRYWMEAQLWHRQSSVRLMRPHTVVWNKLCQNRDRLPGLRKGDQFSSSLFAIALLAGG